MTFSNLNGNFLTEGTGFVLPCFAPLSGGAPKQAVNLRRDHFRVFVPSPYSTPGLGRMAKLLAGLLFDAGMESHSLQAGASRREMPGPRLAVSAIPSCGVAH